MLQCDAFLGKSWFIVIDARRSCCSTDLRFHKARYSPGVARVVYEPLWAKISQFDFGRNASTLSEFIGYADLTDFREILPDHSRDNDKRKFVGKFWYLTDFLVASIYTQRVLHIFSYSNFRCGYLDNQSECRKSPTHFCWLTPCD